MNTQSELSHDKLVDIARRFLFRKCAVVLTEVASLGEQPDAIGWQGGISVLVECKVSLSDFYSDSSKPFRRHPYAGMGNYRYYLTPKGLLENRKIPEGWGVLETAGRTVSKRKEAKHFNEVNKVAELALMSSAIRRIGQTTPSGVSVRAYYTHTGEKATATIELEDL